MPDLSGLQIEVRCFRCGRVPTAEVTLYEMQNHLYICHICRQEAEQRGKHIAWVNSGQMQVSPRATSMLPLSVTASPTRQLTSNLPPDSVWARLELPLDTPFSTIRQTAKQQMRLWMQKPDSAEKRNRIALLRECMEQLEDEEAVEAERERLRAVVRKEGSPLSVGGRLVLTAKEFLEACEVTQEGWADGERYLRTGELSQWILFQLGERELAKEARRYKDWNEVSNFRALNEILYCLVPERPFRLYKREAWQNQDTVPSAYAPRELATLCDIHWESAVPHLYEGSMLYWLEHSRGLQGLQAYYKAEFVYYANQWQDRGVGLELLLERAVPDLEKPQLVAGFDGNQGFYSLKNWDREIPHQPVSVTITNVTRGYTSFDISLQEKTDVNEPDWINLRATTVRGRPGAGMPASASIELDHLSQLKRGRRYRRKFYMNVRSEKGQSNNQALSVELKTMSFFRGLRGRLWVWGLRGNIPGLLWNAAAGALLAVILLWLIPALIPQTFLGWSDQVGSNLSLGIIVQACLAGLVSMLRFDAIIPGHAMGFPWVVAALLGFVGFWVGIGKGHSDYQERQNAAGFRKGAFWLALCYVLYLLYPEGGYSAISTAFQYGNSIYRNYLIVNGIQYSISALLLWMLIFLIACLLAFLHYRVEKLLRYQNREMLNPPGRQ